MGISESYSFNTSTSWPSWSTGAYTPDGSAVSRWRFDEFHQLYDVKALWPVRYVSSSSLVRRTRRQSVFPATKHCHRTSR